MDDEKLTTEDSAVIEDGIIKKKKSWIKIAIGAAIVLVCGIVISRIMSDVGVINPYEADYIDVTGRTAEELAIAKGMDYDEFLRTYRLPEDMPKTTFERAVYYNIPVGVFVERNGTLGTFEDLKADMGWGDDITVDTPLGKALDKTTLSKYVGDEQLERFKTLYDLPDDVTGDTLYGEVRNIVDSKEKEFREAEESQVQQ